MSLKVLSEFFSSLAEGALHIVGLGTESQWIRDRKVDVFFKNLNEAQQQAFLEVITGAVLDDGKITPEEMALLESSRGLKNQLDSALATARKAMPFADKAAQMSWLSGRASVFTAPTDREEVFTTVAYLLIASGAENADAIVGIYAEVFQIPFAKVEEIRSHFALTYITQNS